MKTSSLAPLAALTLLTLAACGTISGADAARAAALESQKTAKVVFAAASGPVELHYALFNISSKAAEAKKYALTVSSYNVCGWGLAHGWDGHPNRESIVALYLLNQSGGSLKAPVAGTYQVQTPAAGATGLFIDPATSGYGIFGEACTGTWPGLASGTVTLTSANPDTGAFAGSFDLVLGDGSTLTGPFTTGACTGIEADSTDAKTTNCSW